MFPVRDLNTGKIKYVGRSKAKVIDNRDPMKRGRIRVYHPLVENNSWIQYLMAPNTFDVPNVGDLVYIEADCGYTEYLIAWGNVTKGDFSSPQIPEGFKRDVPTNFGFYTSGGHLVELDDGEAEPTSNPEVNDISDTNKGIRITTSSGNKIHISDEDGSITIETSGDVNVKSGGDANVEAGGSATIEATATITLKTPLNAAAPGLLVAAVPLNNDPITGIPLVPSGGVKTE